ncbi:cysteine-rich motor neuron 1 protein-like [Branchiostoma floridae]|uniref:Cysteine-rich motor neuron 1 protein-like n=1 Tax=Branchiostoma floridae TaxID=7739 RepID=A0A9J7LPH6_BRAFL|nr:cysteine-rich motor neuron 1 protein-like [Branchiostoma floridae]
MAPRALLLLLAVGFSSPLDLYCPCFMEADFTCPAPPTDCELISDACGCCDVCARQEGESCGYWLTGCASGLTCVYPECDTAVQQVVQPDGSVIQMINPCVSLNFHGYREHVHHRVSFFTCFYWPSFYFHNAKRHENGVQQVPIVDLVPYCDHVTAVEGCQYDGVTIPVGTECKVDDCTWCYCPVAGQNPGCVTQDCPAPPCPNPVSVPGQCCPVCRSPTLEILSINQ